MLAIPGDRVPTGAEWAHEVKWDGMRLLAEVQAGQVRLTSRTERDVTVAFPELAGLATQFEDMLLDGEAVVLRDGIPSFAALAERFHVTSPAKAGALAARAPVTFMVFDLLRLYGVDLTARTWTDRRATLERLELAGPHWQVPPTFDDGQALWEATGEQGLGGAQQVIGVVPDMSAFGKVIGGGMPVGAIGGSVEVMDMMAPLGPVYQAGTLSGNPIAMAAGLATLDIIEQPGFMH